MKSLKALAGPVIALWALALVAGCGADGGVGGTGISTLTGNVTLSAASASRISVNAEGIRVGIRGTNLQTLTDRTGEFELEGAFDGNVVVDFTEIDGTINHLAVEVPSAGTISLRNVRFDRGAATAERIDVDFEATVSQDAVCQDSGSTVLVTDRNERNAYGILLDDAEYESDSARCDLDHPPGCADLLAQRTLRVVGTQSNGPIRADRIRLVNCRIPGSGGR